MRVRIIISILFLTVASGFLFAQDLKKKRGTVKFRDTEGRVYAKGKARNYKRHGEWKTFDEKGRIREIQEWNAGVRQGRYVVFYESGVVQDSGAFENNFMSGKWVTRNSNGTLAIQKEYKNGKLNGEYLMFYPDGTLREASHFSNDTVLDSKKWKPDGSLASVEKYCAGVPCGKWIEYPDDSRFSQGKSSHYFEMEYMEGKLHGTSAEFRNGIKVAETEYENGLINGAVRTWNTEGVILTEGNYINGQPHGAQKEFKSGALIRTVVYSRGIMQGRSSDYNLTGRIIEDRWYSRGLLDSAAAYHANGKRSGAAYYGIFEDPSGFFTEGSHFEYDSAGVIILRGNSVEHRKNGVWTSYYPNGKVNSTTTYVNGIPQGLYTRYYTNGKKMVQYNILPSGLNTPPDVWDEKGKVLSFGDPRYQELYESSRPIESFNNGKPEELGLTREDQMKESSRKRSEEDNNVYEVVDVMPQFPGGEDAKLNFLAKTIIYPRLAKENGEQGTIYVKYIVEKDGSIIEASPRDGNFSSLVLAMEAVRVVRLFPTHTPGMLNGVPVRTQLVIPVKFVLQ